jgi:hypothetical protein
MSCIWSKRRTGDEYILRETQKTLVNSLETTVYGKIAERETPILSARGGPKRWSTRIVSVETQK